jgi:hypothetical protein
MKIRILILGVLLVSGCASEILSAYVGKTLMEPVLDYGPPTYSFEIDKENRAFMWVEEDEVYIPGHVTTTGHASTAGNAYGQYGMATYAGNTSIYTNTVVTPPQSYTTDCRYVLYAKQKVKNPEGPNDWVVTGFRKPSFACE